MTCPQYPTTLVCLHWRQTNLLGYSSVARDLGNPERDSAPFLVELRRDEFRAMVRGADECPNAAGRDFDGDLFIAESDCLQGAGNIQVGTHQRGYYAG